MVQKNPAYLWYPKDWKSDPRVQQASISTRGAWREWLDQMHFADSDRIDGTFEGLGRLIGVSAEVAKNAIEELKTLGIANVTFCHSRVTLLSRRLGREHLSRKQASERKRKQRSHATSQTNPDPPRTCARPGTGKGSSSIDKRESEREKIFSPEVEALYTAFVASMQERDLDISGTPEKSKDILRLMLQQDSKKDRSITAQNMRAVLAWLPIDFDPTKSRDEWGGWGVVCLSTRALRRNWSRMVRKDEKKGVWDFYLEQADASAKAKDEKFGTHDMTIEEAIERGELPPDYETPDNA